MKTNPPAKKPVISYLIVMGDSLSDRGKLDHRYLLGFIPLSWLSGLAGKSPQGRFTNGFNWCDYTSAALLDEFTIHTSEKRIYPGRIHQYNLNLADVSDAIITKRYTKTDYTGIFNPQWDDSTDIADNIISNRSFKAKFEHSYTLDNDTYVSYAGQTIARTYCEGGLMDHDYSWKPSASPTIFFSRIILAKLKEKRSNLIAYDNNKQLSAKRKARTLIIEWSGANDLITVNEKPTTHEADLAIKERMININSLISAGYKYFILFNLPNLSLTPRYQNMKGPDGEKKRQHTSMVCDYFNKSLTDACHALQASHPDCTIRVFDANSRFTDIYSHPENYPCHFEKSKMTTPYTSSKDFIIYKGISPASGYMFWDDVHPTEDMQALLGAGIFGIIKDNVILAQPASMNAKALYDAFITKYSTLLRSDKLGIFGLFKQRSLPDIHPSCPEDALVTILRHALIDGGNRTRQAMTELGWIDRQGTVNTDIPALKLAHDKLYSSLMHH